ncbi:hypothetical protein ScPMuIL_011442 [Solemya velum]
MEEVDQIIIHSLNTIGCDIEDDVVSLKQFSTELIVAAAVSCVKSISNENDLPSTLPGGMSARFRMGTTLANAIQELGYRGEIGYQTFLYSNESDIRKVFMFLVDKLPKETVEAMDEPLGASVLLQKAISASVARHLTSPWLPPFLKDHGVAWRGKPPVWQREGACSLHGFYACHLTRPHGSADLTKKISKELKQYYCQCLPFVTNQTAHHHDTLPSVLELNGMEIAKQHEWENEWNQYGLASRLSEEEYKSKKRQRVKKRIIDQLKRDVERADAKTGLGPAENFQQLIDSITSRTSTGVKGKGSRFTHTEKLLFAKDEEKAVSQLVGETATHSEEELQKEREEELNSLREELNNVSSQFSNLDLDVKKFTAGIQELEERLTLQKKENEENEKSYSIKKRTLDLLPDAENNISKLQAVVDASAQRLANLANQWEKHRAPLIQQIQELKELNSKRESEAQVKLGEIKTFREKMKSVADEARNKEEIQKQLLAEYERMAKDVNRSAYTKKIMEIVANIKKQKNDIDKVLVDTRTIQKEINLLSGKLDRTFTVTDELIFKDAKKDESVKKAYRFLAALHENCELLIRTVEDTGIILREIRELEDQIENESNKKVLSNLEKITADYREMRKENAALIAKLKQKS